MSEHRRALGAAIRAARGSLTYGEFAMKCGLATVTVWRYENGTRVPCSPNEIDALASAGVDRTLLYAAANEHGCLVVTSEALA